MKPIHDNLKSVRIEDDDTGDLLPLLDYAGQHGAKRKKTK